METLYLTLSQVNGSGDGTDSRGGVITSYTSLIRKDRTWSEVEEMKSVNERESVSSKEKKVPKE